MTSGDVLQSTRWKDVPESLHPSLRELELRVGKPSVPRYHDWSGAMETLLDHLAIPNLQKIVLSVTVHRSLLAAEPEDWYPFRENLEAISRYPAVKELQLKVQYKASVALDLECEFVSASATPCRYTKHLSGVHSSRR
jgi:hypothetical protein